MKKILILLLSIALVNTGCEKIDFGDTNKNVNGPSDPNTASLLSGAITNFSTRTGRPYRVTPTLNVQYFMQHVYNDEMLYANGPGYWSSYYVQTLSNLKTVIDICSDEASSSNPLVVANGAVENQIAVAKIFKSVIFKRVTDLFGDVPYSEALQSPDILLPKYDSQEDIYKGMIAEVKEARDMIDVTKAGPSGDVIYDGDMVQWQKFANSFLLSLSIQMSKVYPSATGFAATEFKAALAHSAGVIEDVADDAVYTYDVENGFDNPWNWPRPADYGLTKEFSDALKGNASSITSNSMMDNRLNLFAKDPSKEGLPYGYEEYASGEDSPLADIIFEADTRLSLLTAAYTYLHRAEASVLGWTAEDAAVMLKRGIMASYVRHAAIYDATGLLAIGDGSAYADARVADMVTATGGAVQVIAEEKWVALFPQGYDAWSEWRRTGYPILSPAADALNNGEIPRRYNYPSDEPTLNEDGYNSGVASLSPAQDTNTARVWWDQD